MTTLRELHEQRAAIDKEIRSREEELVKLSFDNLYRDLPSTINGDTKLIDVAKAAGAYGLALMTTKGLEAKPSINTIVGEELAKRKAGNELFKKVYASTEGETFSDVAKRIISGQELKEAVSNFCTTCGKAPDFCKCGGASHAGPCDPS